jgi:hypothetical protein
VKDEIKDLLVSMGIMSAGYYARLAFGRSKFNVAQKVALFLVGTSIVLIVHQLKIQDIYKLSIVMVSGLLLPNIINAVIRGGDGAESKAAKNIEKNIDKFTK